MNDGQIIISFFSNSLDDIIWSSFLFLKIGLLHIFFFSFRVIEYNWGNVEHSIFFNKIIQIMN